MKDFTVEYFTMTEQDAIEYAKAINLFPKEAELTGPSFTPNERTLFLSVQHPGEETEDKANPTSTWPQVRGGNQPRPSVVAITGFKF